MDIAMTTTTVMPTVAAPRPRIESVLGTEIAQPLTWHGDSVRMALPAVGNAGTAALNGRVVSDVPTAGVFATSRTVVADTRTTAKQPHPPRGVPR